MRPIRSCSIALLLSLTCITASAFGQTMVQTTVPLQNNSESFFESTNVGWSVRGPGFFATFNGAAPPPFGGFNPNAGLTTGFAFRGNRLSGNLNFNFSQGFSRTSTTVAPTVMSLNGQPAFFFDGTVRPFVYSVVPTLGGGVGGPFFSVPPGRMPRGFGPGYDQRIAQLRQQLAQGRKELAAESQTTSRVEREATTPTRRELNTSERASAAFRFFQGGGSRTTSTSKTASRTTPEPQKPQTSGFQLNDEPKTLAELYFRKGLEAETRSTPTARMYYRMAFQRATGDLRTEIDRRLRKIGR